jgi:hypothetical protein
VIITRPTAETLRIGDGAGWRFVNGAWSDGEGGLLTMPDETRALEGRGIQNFHYAFHTAASFGDARVRFEFRLTPHSDVGVILRARDASRFCLLHFPNGGQASRGQHFLAAYSKMEGDGFLRMIKLDLVRRVPSLGADWLRAEVSLRRDALSVGIGDHGQFEARDATFSEPGAIGVFLFRDAGLRNVVVEGQPLPSRWQEAAEPPGNWFLPCPDTRHGLWQKPRDLIRRPSTDAPSGVAPSGGTPSGGELLLNYSVQEKPYTGKITPLLARSRDGGRTWSEPQPFRKWHDDWPDEQPRLHVTPKGRLIAMLQNVQGRFEIAESTDRGRTWSDMRLISEPLQIKGLARFSYIGGPQPPLNLADGSMLLFGIGYPPANPDLTVYTWGALHAQAFASRSENDGRTWSLPVNVDNVGRDANGKPYEGNLDLTEVAGVQLRNGKIFGLIRPIYSPWMWEASSDDGGRTWGPCVRGPFAGYATSNMLRTSSGALLLAHRVPGLTIHVSRDEGHTWDQGTLIDSGLWALGSMVEVEPDLVLYIYWDTMMSFMRGQFLRVTPERLEPVVR